MIFVGNLLFFILVTLKLFTKNHISMKKYFIYHAEKNIKIHLLDGDGRNLSIDGFDSEDQAEAAINKAVFVSYSEGRLIRADKSSVPLTIRAIYHG